MCVGEEPTSQIQCSVMAGGRMGRRDDNWTKFEEYARQRESSGEGSFSSTRHPLSPTSGRLHKEDMAIYGREPATDKMVLVVCEICDRVVKSQAYLRHRELYHSQVLRVPPLRRNPIVSPIQTYGQSSANSGLGGGGGKKSKGFDLDRHCGVWIDVDKKYCKKSISCKIHSLEQRRRIQGRSKPFAELLAEYKKNKKLRKLEKLKSTGQAARPPISPLTTPTLNQLPTSPSPTLSPDSMRGGNGGVVNSLLGDSPPHSSIALYFDGMEDEIEDGIEEMEGIDSQVIEGSQSVEEMNTDDVSYPKPAAVCSFEGRGTTGCGLTLYSHRYDTLRSSLISLSGRERELHDVPESSILRRYNHLFRQRPQKQKYAYLGDQNHILLCESKFNPISSSSSIVSPSVTVPITTKSTEVIAPAIIKTTSFYNTRHSNRRTSDSSIITNSNIPNEGGVVNESPPTKGRKRSRRSSKAHNAQTDKQESLHVSIPNTRQLINHVSETDSEYEVFRSDKGEEIQLTDPVNMKQELLRNHIDESALQATPTSGSLNLHQLKMPPLMNGVLQNTLSPTVQPFSLHSNQTYLINPSQQHRLISRGVYPLRGLGVSSPPPNSLQPFPTAAVPTMPSSLSFPSDKMNPHVLQVMSQNHILMQASNNSEISNDNLYTQSHPTEYSNTSISNNVYNQQRLGNQSNQFENQSSSSSSRLGNLSNQFENQSFSSSSRLGNQSNQFENQSSSSSSSMTNFYQLQSNFPPPLTYQQMTASGLVQSSPNISETSPHPPPPPLNVPSPSSTPSLHRLPSSGKQNAYLHPPGIVTRQTSAHRTQRVS